MTFAIAARLLKISLYSAMLASVFSCSFIRASISSPISLYRRISKMASAWRSVKRRLCASFWDCADLKAIPSVIPSVRQALAILTFALPRRISMIRSITSQAWINPSCTSFFSSSFASSVVYFLFASSYWKFT